jgi:hypothetical protein
MSFRPLTLLALLVGVGLLMYRTSDPAMWKFLEPGTKHEVPLSTTTTNAVSPPERTNDGPTDLDTEEAAAAIEESGAITDRGLSLQVEEMPLYWRIFGWVQHQSIAKLQKRAARDIPFNEFMQSPGPMRGQLVQLKLNVRRILKYDAPENPSGVQHVYEIWGWTDESQAWPYVVVVPELPAGMPVGEKVYERATFAGYFFKLQGYYAAGAGPNDKPLAAPLLIGRVDWPPSLAQAPSQPSYWPWIFVGGAMLIIGGNLLWWMWRRKAPQSRRQREFEPKSFAAGSEDSVDLGEDQNRTQERPRDDAQWLDSEWLFAIDRHKQDTNPI